MTFSICTGLGVDYEMFLLSTIREYIKQGFSTSAAITKGVYRSGQVISGAGVMMTLAFICQLASSIPLLRQSACVLITSILLDTFVVRTALSPAIMQLIGDWNWWPGISPKEMATRTKGVENTIIEIPGGPAHNDLFTVELDKILKAQGKWIRAA